MLKIAAVLAVPLAMFTAVANTSFLVVDVQESGPDGVHLVLPVPLLLAQAAVNLAPESKTRVHIPEIEEYLPAAEKMVEALRRAPDAELVRVEESDETVVISKAGDWLEVQVDGRREEVSVRLPLATVADVLSQARGGSIDAGSVIASLRSLRRTDLVEVRDGNDHVKVWVW